MSYSLNKKIIDLDKVDLIGSDSLSDVYKVNRGIALRVYKNNVNNGLVISEEDCKYLSNIPCDRILLPKKLLYRLVYINEYYFGYSYYCGYSYKILNKNSKKEKMIETSIEDFISDVELLEEDVETLSKNRVMLDGITPDNVVYSDGLYLTDVTQFKVLDGKNFNYRDLRKLNDYQIQLLLESIMISELKKEDFSDNKIYEFISILEDRNPNLIKPSKYYNKLFEYSDNVKEFVKKI